MSLATQRGMPGWKAIDAACKLWVSQRRPTTADVPITFYRDANSWCPFCHRVWFFLELKGLRYETERVHLQGDPAEPPKQQFYRKLVPSGVVPALRLRGQVVTESLDILYRLEREFPNPRLLPTGFEAIARQLADRSGAFNTDECGWLHNTQASKEAALQARVLESLHWLDATLIKQGGPFFLGEQASLVEAAYVGFLTRCAHNYLYFKNLDIRDPEKFPNIAAWFKAMEAVPAYQTTKQDAYFEQRIYQAHPHRRPYAEPCMQLGSEGSCIGEPDCNMQPAQPVATLEAGSAAALEAAAALSARHAAVTQFLQRKNPHDSSNPEVIDSHLEALAAVLAGLTTPHSAVEALGTLTPAVRSLGSLIGTPRDMSSAAASQLRGALLKMDASEELPAAADKPQV